MSSSSPGQPTCDLCKGPLASYRFEGKVSRSEMEIIARNGFGKKAAGFQNIEPSQRRDEFLSFVVRSHIDSWWLCPRCFEKAMTYRWTYQLYQIWLKDRLKIAGAILGSIAGACAIIFSPRVPGQDWPNFLAAIFFATALVGFVSFAVGAFVGYVVGSMIDFVRIQILRKDKI